MRADGIYDGMASPMRADDIYDGMTPPNAYQWD